MSTKTALAILISMVALAIGLGLVQGYSAPPDHGPNVAQFSSPSNSTIACTVPLTPRQPTDLQVSLTTDGNPVLVYFATLVRLDPVSINLGASASFHVMIDGVEVDASAGAFVAEFVLGSHLSTPTFARIYNVSKGTHLFQVVYACDHALLGPRWLTVWELGSGRP